MNSPVVGHPTSSGPWARASRIHISREAICSNLALPGVVCASLIQLRADTKEALAFADSLQDKTTIQDTR